MTLHEKLDMLLNGGNFKIISFINNGNGTWTSTLTGKILLIGGFAAGGGSSYITKNNIAITPINSGTGGSYGTTGYNMQWFEIEVEIGDVIKNTYTASNSCFFIVG